MIELFLGNIEWVLTGGAVLLAFLFKLRGDAHKAKADKLEGYKETRSAIDEANIFTAGSDAREFLRNRRKP